MHRPPAPSSPSPVPAVLRTRWWLTIRARIGFFLAVPVLGLISPYLGFVVMVVAIVLVWKDTSWSKGVKVAATFAAFTLLGSVAPDQPRIRPQAPRRRRTGKPR
ncbi:hypothetical protein GCM10010274_63440 [Streptomyces lavendofoliae]|uniref:Uncharacterized protein n=1 Tax=Streptomyces lavendofoliae TaxID=67314 RepID=A0A918I5Z2_9ACTN|nr:hypothetical protein GCM10010274_63440 [Streptomyces lavendofoliae]